MTGDLALTTFFISQQSSQDTKLTSAKMAGTLAPEGAAFREILLDSHLGYEISSQG